MVMSVQKLAFSKIYATHPRDMNDLIQRIPREADAIKQNLQLLRRNIQDMIRRTRECIEKNGRHLRGTHNLLLLNSLSRHIKSYSVDI